MKLFLLLSLLLQLAAVPSTDAAAIATCDEQSQCLKITKEVATSTDALCPGDCSLRVCIEFIFSGSSGAQCQIGASGQISHVCALDIGDGADLEAEQCQPAPFQFTKDMKLGNVGDGTKHCIQVIPGEDALFILKDGNADGMCNSNNEVWFGNNNIPPGTTCHQFYFTNLDPDDPDYGACSGNGNADKQCVWMVPTSVQDCDLNDPQPPPPNGVSGDPHFKTWHGHKFSYHGACDLILLQHPTFRGGVGLDIHVRSQHLREFSYITSAAVRIGSDVLEVSTAPRDKGFYLNRQPYPTLPAYMDGKYEVTHEYVNDLQQTYVVSLDADTKIVLKTWRYFISVKIEGPRAEDFAASVGIMGNFTTGERLARDGVTVMDDDDVNSYGQEWQVGADDETLFHTFALPQAPSRCELPQLSTKRRRLGASFVGDDDAQTACAGVSDEDYDFCVFDVLATQDLATAGAYR